MLLLLMVVPDTPLPYVIYTAVGVALIWLAHADNIERLLHGTERKFDLGPLGGKAPPPTESRGRRPVPQPSRESIDPGRLTTRVGDHAGSAGRWSARAERMGIRRRGCSGSSRCSRRACRW